MQKSIHINFDNTSYDLVKKAAAKDYIPLSTWIRLAAIRAARNDQPKPMAVDQRAAAAAQKRLADTRSHKRVERSESSGEYVCLACGAKWMPGPPNANGDRQLTLADPGNGSCDVATPYQPSPAARW